MKTLTTPSGGTFTSPAEQTTTKPAGFTKGPWEVGPWFGNEAQVCAHDGTVARVLGTSATRRETEANARLIATVPELLATLETVTDFLAVESIGKPQERQIHDIVKRAQSAIRKAKGE